MQPAIDQLIDDTVSAMGFELWGCAFRHAPGQGVLLCVYVDGASGVTSDNCSEIARQLRAVLAVESTLADPVSLEVSSPGIERQLYKLSHYERYVGHRVKFRLVKAKNNQRRYEGEIQRVDKQGKTVVICVNEEPWTLVLEEIDKAHLVVEF